jgi:hypothetical protein
MAGFRLLHGVHTERPDGIGEFSALGHDFLLSRLKVLFTRHALPVATLKVVALPSATGVAGTAF